MASSAQHPLGVRVRKVDLVHRDDDRHLGGARVRDRLLRLRHDAVVGGDDEDGDVGRPSRRGRACAVNASWPGVSRNVTFRPSTRDLVRADVLRDPAGLGLDHLGVADRVEQRRLAVVDVAHDRDDGRPRDEVLRVVLDDSGSTSSSSACLIVTSRFSSAASSSTSSSVSDCVAVFRRAEAHQDLDDVLHPDAERLREVADGDARLEADRPGRRDDLARLLRRRRAPSLVARAAVVRARPGGAGVDHDTASASCAPPPWRGLIGLFGPSAIGSQCRGLSGSRFDSDGPPQDARERALSRPRARSTASRRHV